MRLLDTESGRSVWQAQLYLEPAEARELRDALDKLLVDPDRNEHEHLLDSNGRDLSFSILTPTKLASGGYTARERSLFAEKR